MLNLFRALLDSEEGRLVWPTVIDCTSRHILYTLAHRLPDITLFVVLTNLANANLLIDFDRVHAPDGSSSLKLANFVRELVNQPKSLSYYFLKTFDVAAPLPSQECAIADSTLGGQSLLCELPDQVLGEILKRCNIKDASAVGRSCQMLFRQIFRHSIIWQFVVESAMPAKYSMEKSLASGNVLEVPWMAVAKRTGEASLKWRTVAPKMQPTGSFSLPSVRYIPSFGMKWELAPSGDIVAASRDSTWMARMKFGKDGALKLSSLAERPLLAHQCAGIVANEKMHIYIAKGDSDKSYEVWELQETAESAGTTGTLQMKSSIQLKEGSMVDSHGIYPFCPSRDDTKLILGNNIHDTATGQRICYIGSLQDNVIWSPYSPYVFCLYDRGLLNFDLRDKRVLSWHLDSTYGAFKHWEYLIQSTGHIQACAQFKSENILWVGGPHFAAVDRRKPSEPLVSFVNSPIIKSPLLWDVIALDAANPRVSMVYANLDGAVRHTLCDLQQELSPRPSFHTLPAECINTSLSYRRSYLSLLTSEHLVIASGDATVPIQVSCLSIL